MRHLERDKLNGGSVKKGERSTNHLHLFFYKHITHLFYKQHFYKQCQAEIGKTSNKN